MPHIDIEVARKSWHDAPDKHVSQAIRNIDSYEVQVRSIIISEAQERFGENYLPEVSDPSAKVNADSIKGIGRLHYFCVIFFAAFIAAFFAGFVRKNETMRYVPQVLMWIVTIILSHARFKNIGWNGYWAFLAAIPVICVFVVFACLIFPEGYQKTKRIDLAGIIVTWIVVGLFVLTLIAIFTP